MPSFGDGHAHPLLGGLEYVGPAVRPCTSVDEIVAEVRRVRRRASRRRVDRRRLLRQQPRAGRPVRRPLARRGGARPARGVAGVGLPHHVGATPWRCDARASRPTPRTRCSARSRTATTARCSARCASGARSTCHCRHARPRRGRPCRRAGHGRRLLPGPRRDLGAGRLGRARRRRHLRRGGPARRAADPVQPGASTPIRATSTRRWRISPRPGAGSTRSARRC